MSELMLLCIIFIGVFAALIMAMIVGINILLGKSMMKKINDKAMDNLIYIIGEGKRD